MLQIIKRSGPVNLMLSPKEKQKAKQKPQRMNSFRLEKFPTVTMIIATDPLMMMIIMMAVKTEASETKTIRM